MSNTKNSNSQVRSYSDTSKNDTKSNDKIYVGESPIPGLTLIHMLNRQLYLAGKDKVLIKRVAWLPSERKLAVSFSDGVIRAWDVDTENLQQTFEKHSWIVYGIAWSPDGLTLASASRDHSVRLWDSETGKLITSLKGHKAMVLSVAWSANGKILASCSDDSTIRLWDTIEGKTITILHHPGLIQKVSWFPNGQQLVSVSTREPEIYIWDVKTGLNLFKRSNSSAIYSIAWSPDGSTFACGCADGTIRLWDSNIENTFSILEGHLDSVTSVSFSFNGLVLASKSRDSTVRLWRTDNWSIITVMVESHSESITSDLAFHPSLPLLATLDEGETIIRIWHFNFELLLSHSEAKSIRYTTVKIALVGDSGVGKTGLGWRLAHGKFKAQSSTHGQQFWTIPELGLVRNDGTLCEAVLWDLAGQQDYRLVHALFLKDVDFALVLFDPGNREKPLSGVKYWLKQLSYEQQHLQIMLIGARIDRGLPTMTKAELDDFCEFNNVLGGYLATSAQRGDGINTLIEKLKLMIPWQELPATVTTRTFKRVKEFVISLKELTSNKSVLVSPLELRHQLEKTDRDWEFTDDEMITAVKHLENHGYVTICKDSNGEQSILLFPDILINLASSFVLEARGNIQGLGVLEEKKLLSGDYEFPDLKKIDNEDEREVLLDSATVLFLKQNICFRESLDGAHKRSLLVFPSLINEKRPRTGDTVTEDDVTYLITGSVENVYASMVVLLGYTEHFTRKHQWQNQAQYELKENEICGFRQISEHEDEIELTLYYNEVTPQNGRMLFQGLFETFLQHRDVKIKRYERVICSHCNERQERASVMNQIKRRRNFIFCSNCGYKIDIPRTTELISVTGVDRETIIRQEAVVAGRTQFETAMVRIKGILREQKQLYEPTCFISYSWGVLAHEKWVLQLAKDLRKADVDILLDRWHNIPGASITKFIDKIDQVKFVLAVGTINYRKKYETETEDPVVDMEIRMIQTRLRQRTKIRETVLPLLLEGTQSSAFPPQFKDQVYLDFSNKKRYFVDLFRLILRLYNIPFDNPGLDELIETMESKD